MVVLAVDELSVSNSDLRHLMYLGPSEFISEKHVHKRLPVCVRVGCPTHGLCSVREGEIPEQINLNSFRP